jgi:hypothetical protein
LRGSPRSTRRRPTSTSAATDCKPAATPRRRARSTPIPRPSRPGFRPWTPPGSARSTRISSRKTSNSTSAPRSHAALAREAAYLST